MLPSLEFKKIIRRQKKLSFIPSSGRICFNNFRSRLAFGFLGVVRTMETDKKEMQQEHQTDERQCSLLGMGSHVGHIEDLYCKTLPCFGCGIGWFCFVAGFIFPPLWYYATILYLSSCYLKDPREREGLAASAIAALICSVMVLILTIAVFL